MADAVGTDRAQISRWENGVAVPSLESLVKICQSLGCSADELLGTRPNNLAIPNS